MRIRHYLFLVGLLVFLSNVALASPPAWWTGNGTAILDGNFTGNTSITNYAPVNIGQLKKVATQAKTYLNSQLSSMGGAGAGIPSFTHNTTTDYAPANLGQLKAVAKPFYDRLSAVFYDTTANLIAHGYPGTWTGIYPWPPAPPAFGQPGYDANTYNAWLQEEYAPANLGQVKMVFSFDLALSATTDTDGDGLPDWWELYFFGTLGAGFSGYPNYAANLSAYQNGTTPSLTIHVVISSPQNAQQF